MRPLQEVSQKLSTVGSQRYEVTVDSRRGCFNRGYNANVHAVVLNYDDHLHCDVPLPRRWDATARSIN